MSNNATLRISIKDFAEQRGKTVQAVYQQMKRKENAAALEGHVFTHRVGNKDVKYLDEEAVSILDKSSNSAPLIVLEEGLRADLEETKQQLDIKEKQVAYQEGQISILRDLLAEANEKLMLLSEPQEKIASLEAEKADLSADNEKLEQKLEELQKSAEDERERHQNAINRKEEELKTERERSISFKEYWQRRKKAKSDKTDSNKE